MTSLSRCAARIGFLFALLGAGCGSNSSTVDEASDAQTAKKAIESFPEDATGIHIDLVGASWGAVPPEGSECELNERHWTVDPKTLVGTSNRCTSTGSGAPFEFVRATRTLSRSEYDEIVAAFEALELSTKGECAADAGALSATIRTPRGETTYYDDLEACAAEGKIVVSSKSISALTDKLSTIIPLGS